MTDAPDPRAAADEAARWLARRTGRSTYDAGLVLGSGWGPLAEAWGEPAVRVPMGEVPHFRRPVAEGHGGAVLTYDLDGTHVVVLDGRTHLYEGHGQAAVVHGVRTLAALGTTRLLLTNAGGSLRGEEWEVGRPVLVRDHLATTSTSPLVGPRFVDLTDAWSPRLRARARELDPTLAEGVYAQLRGPHYNTVAEAEWLRRVGADLVGMSTVPEAIAAREAGLELAGLSVVTAIEGSAVATDPGEVVRAAEGTARRLAPLVAALLR